MSEITPVESNAGNTQAGEEHAPLYFQPDRWLLTAGSVACFAAFWFVGRLFHLPADPYFSASLLDQPTLAASLAVTFIIFPVCIIVGSLIASTIHADAGLFCAAIGLLALSLRGGGVRFVLLDASGTDVWLKLTLETVFLAVVLGDGWFVQRLLLRLGLVRDDVHHDGPLELHESIDMRLLALATTVIVMAILMLLLSTTDRKPQTVGAVMVSAFLATVIAYLLSPTQPSIWYWGGSIFVAILGYLLEFAGKYDGWQIGEVRGPFAALARPLPLDYAGAGVAASLFGYWLSRRWHRERETSEVTQPTE